MHEPTIRRYDHAARRRDERQARRHEGVKVGHVIAPFAVDARATETHRYFTPASGYGLPFAHGPNTPEGLRADALRRERHFIRAQHVIERPYQPGTFALASPENVFAARGAYMLAWFSTFPKKP